MARKLRAELKTVVSQSKRLLENGDSVKRPPCMESFLFILVQGTHLFQGPSSELIVGLSRICATKAPSSNSVSVIISGRCRIHYQCTYSTTIKVYDGFGVFLINSENLIVVKGV